MGLVLGVVGWDGGIYAEERVMSKALDKGRLLNTSEEKALFAELDPNGYPGIQMGSSGLIK